MSEKLITKTQLCATATRTQQSVSALEAAVAALEARVAALEAANVTLISFTIDGTSYQAEEGMTWAQWVESEYNTNGYLSVSGNYIYSSADNRYHLVTEDVDDVLSSDAITSDGKYYLDPGVPNPGDAPIITP